MVNIRKTTPKPINNDDNDEMNNSLSIFLDLFVTSNMKNHAMKNNPNDIHNKLRYGTIVTDTGGT